MSPIKSILILLTLTTLLPAQNKPEQPRGWADTPPREYAALQYTYKKTPPAQNGFIPIAETLETLLEKHPDIENLDQKKIKELPLKQRTKLYQDTRKFAPAFIKALAKPNFQAPLRLDFTDSYDDEMNCMNAAKLFNWWTLHSLEHAPQDLTENFNLTTRFTARLYELDGPLVTALIAQACFATQLDTIYQLTSSEKTPRPILQQALQTLPTPEQLNRHLINANAIEFHSFKKIAIDLYEHGVNLTGLMLDQNPGNGSLIDKGIDHIKSRLLRLGYQPNKTIDHAATQYSKIITILNTPKDQTHTIKSPDDQRHKKPTFYLSTNIFGLKLIDLSLPVINRHFIEIRYRNALNTRLTKLLIATRLHHLDHKTLPNTLNDLSPKYLKKIPLDPYTGKPFTYNLHAKTITSTGPKQKLKNPEPLDPENYTFNQLHKHQTPTLLLPF